MERPPVIKDKATLAYVEELERELATIKKSPAFKLYISVQKKIDEICQQFDTTTIDFSTNKDDKGFDRMKICLDKLLDWYNMAEKLKELMTKEEKSEAAEITLKSGSILEKHILNKNE